MARSAKSEKSRVGMWQKRVTDASKIFDNWTDDFRTDQLENYFVGKQWANDDDKDGYTINLCFPTVESKLPAMFFFNPKVTIKPNPARGEDPGSLWDQRSKLLEETADTFIGSKECGFSQSVRLALRESFYRFGVVEVGYSADFVDNPRAGKPMLREDGREFEDVKEPDQVVTGETVYFRHVPAKQFRVSVNANNILIRNDWVGYYEWMYLEDLKEHPVYGAKASKIASFGKMRTSNEMGSSTRADDDEDEKVKAGMVKVWKIWDLRAKEKAIFPDIGGVFLVEGEKFGFLPMAALKFHDILGEFYPLPPMFNWISPQNELNETRESARIHRRRFYRRYLVREGVDDKEMQKLETGGDGVYIKVADINNTIKPVEDAGLDRAVYANVGATKEDFQNITSSGGESRGVAESSTATQANIIDKNMNIRDSFARQIMSEFLSDVVRILLATLIEKMSMPFWIKVNVDPGGPMAAQEAKTVADTWKLITSEDLGQLDYDVEVDVESMSPVNDDVRRNQWSQVLALFSNPTLMMVLLASDTMLRKTLGLYGIKSDRDIQEVRNAMTMLIEQMQAAPPEGGAPGAAMPKAAPGQAAPGPRPNNVDISRQIAAQGV